MGVVGAVIGVADGAVIGVADGIVVGVAGGAAVGIASGIGGAAGGGVGDACVAGKGVDASGIIISLSRVELSWSCKAIVIIGLILMRASPISLSVHL